MNKKIIGITLILIIGLMLFGCTSTDNIPNTTDNSGFQANAQTQNKLYQIGDQITLGDLKYTINLVDSIELLGSEYMVKEPTEGAIFYLAEIKIENLSNSEKTVSISNDITITDSKGRIYKPDTTLAMYANQTGFETLSIFEKIPAGLSKTGNIVFEMPEGTTGQLKINQAFVGESIVEFK